ncbi:hypothetical protein HYALB_00008375 [Hymenoscyphus albidus]|uniref:Uncharacterized protein n=1 Tax=Hymenoscyphus albidus TaxID=595503 RepID=A0A9N9LPR2_9HELO|nr:hypothetical protein HYALB_00008375 [Hymenoscyphus albidus]
MSQANGSFNKESENALEKLPPQYTKNDMAALPTSLGRAVKHYLVKYKCPQDINRTPYQNKLNGINSNNLRVSMLKQYWNTNVKVAITAFLRVFRGTTGLAVTSKNLTRSRLSITVQYGTIWDLYAEGIFLRKSANSASQFCVQTLDGEGCQL